jgi:hypothetical protein
LTKGAAGSQKPAGQKTLITLQATYLLTFSQLLPRYPQPVPQRMGTSQNCDKTGICGGYMSRFVGRLDLFSTIWHRPCGQRKNTGGSGLACDGICSVQLIDRGICTAGKPAPT